MPPSIANPSPEHHIADLLRVTLLLTQEYVAQGYVAGIGAQAQLRELGHLLLDTIDTLETAGSNEKGGSGHR
jgi:hypothetical protein